MPLLGRNRIVQRLGGMLPPRKFDELGRITFALADAVRAEAFRLVSAGSVSGKHHVASKPGEPPNRDTGELQASMTARQTGPKSAEFREDAAHARPLEFGTSKIAARPHVRPARDHVRENATRVIGKEARRILRNASRKR